MSNDFHTPATPAGLDDALERVHLGLHKADARLERLLGTAFEDQARAVAGLRRCLRRFGFDGTLKILNDDGWLPRSHYFGFMRGSLFARGDRARAREALQELPEAIQDRDVLSRERGDLLNVRRTVLEETVARTPVSPEQERDRDNGRGRRRIR